MPHVTTRLSAFNAANAYRLLKMVVTSVRSATALPSLPWSLPHVTVPSFFSVAKALYPHNGLKIRQVIRHRAAVPTVAAGTPRHHTAVGLHRGKGIVVAEDGLHTGGQSDATALLSSLVAIAPRHHTAVGLQRGKAERALEMVCTPEVNSTPQSTVPATAAIAHVTTLPSFFSAAKADALLKMV